MLKINSLVVENFMSISNAELDLNSDIIVISGKSGQGKSAILDAIALCLSSKKRSSLYAEYVKQGKTHAKIILDCDINNKKVNFNLQLNLIRGTPFQMELTVDDKIYKNTEAEEIIKSFDLDYFSDIIFSMQNDADITQLSPTQRANYLQRLLNFDFTKQKTEITNQLVVLNEKLKNIENDINIKDILIKKETSNEEKEIQLDLTEKDIQKFQLKISENQNKIIEYQYSQDSISQFNKEINQINQSILEIERKNNNIINKINQIEEYTKKHDEDERNLITINNNITNALEELVKIKESKEKGESDIIILRKELREIDDRMLYTKEYLDTYNRLAELEKEKKCPMCGRETTEFLKEYLDKLNNEQYDGTDAKGHTFYDVLMIKKDKGDNFSNILDKIDEKYSELNNKKSDLKIKEEVFKLSVNLNTSQLVKLESQLEVLQKNKEELQNSINKLNTDFDDFLNLKNSKKSNDEQIIKYEQNIEDITQKINEISASNDAAKLSQLSNEIVSLNKKINEYYNIIKTNEDITSRNLIRKENIIKYNKEIDILKEELIEIINSKNTYNDAFNILDKNLPNYMIVKTCANLQNEMNTFIQSIFPNYEVELQNSKKGVEFFYTKDNTIKASTKKNNYIINSKMSSGFERSALTLAFKVSLASLYNCDALLLDEADGAADDESSLKLYENLLNNQFNQVFIISHKNELKEYLQENYSNIKIYNVENGQFKLQEN